jgi:hypothetical protein
MMSAPSARLVRPLVEGGRDREHVPVALEQRDLEVLRDLPAEQDAHTTDERILRRVVRLRVLEPARLEPRQRVFATVRGQPESGGTRRAANDCLAPAAAEKG